MNRSIGRAVSAVLLILAAGRAGAQQKTLTLDDIYDPQKKVDFGGKPVTGLAWLDEAHYLWSQPAAEGQPAQLMKVDALTGKGEPLVDAARMQAALGAIEGVSADDARRASTAKPVATDAAHSTLVVPIAGDLYLYDAKTGQAQRLTRAAGDEEETTLSPDARQVAFVRGNDLVTSTVAEGMERRLTTDGSEEVLNGKLDWIYQEEVYGRGNFRSYWWSPDSSRLAFLRLDEKGVPRYTIVDDIPYRPTVEVYPYPKAGDPNPTVKLGIAPATGGATLWVDLAKYAGGDFLIVDVAWQPDGRGLSFQVQDREQTWLDLNVADPATGQVRTLLRETTKAWVEPHGSPRWLEDGSFLWLSERTGFKHLYRYAPDGTLLRPLTQGRWEVRTLHGVDPKTGWIYYSGTQKSARELQPYRVRTGGGQPQALSKVGGTHTLLFSPGLTYFLDTWSDVNTPPQVRLHKAEGNLVRVVDANAAPALAAYRLARPEFVQVPTRDGFVMEAVLIKPPDFDPARKYPVYQFTYGGPHAPQVKDGWGGQTYMFHQLLAQKGVVVWICDNRSASGKGAESAWPVYKRFGPGELADVEDGLQWLKKQPWVDGTRIGISGWSFGGFMAANALTRSTSFAMGIAGGPVTDWRDYDSIYTERYMRTPGNNAEGYADLSPRAAAARLHGKLLLLHGSIDDNVHPQNTQQFAYELQKAGIPFNMVLYPKSRHGFTDPLLIKHRALTMLQFIEETLLGR